MRSAPTPTVLVLADAPCVDCGRRRSRHLRGRPDLTPHERVSPARVRSVPAVDDALDAHVRDAAFDSDLAQRCACSVRLPNGGVTLRGRNIGVTGCIANKLEHPCGGHGARVGLRHGTPHPRSKHTAIASSWLSVTPLPPTWRNVTSRYTRSRP